MIERDTIVYIILFTLISLGALKQSNDRKNIEEKVRDLNEKVLMLTVQQKRLERKADILEMRLDSLYLQSNL